MTAKNGIENNPEYRGAARSILRRLAGAQPLDIRRHQSLTEHEDEEQGDKAGPGVVAARYLDPIAWNCGNQGIDAADIVDAEDQHQRHADRQNGELDQIGEHHRPHAAEGRVKNDDAAADRNSNGPIQAIEHVEDDADGADLRADDAGAQEKRAQAGDDLADLAVGGRHDVANRDGFREAVHLRRNEAGNKDFLEAEAPQPDDIDDAEQDRVLLERL